MNQPDPSRPPAPQLHPGDIVLFNRATGMNHLITLLTRSQYYHVAICAGSEQVVEARPGGVMIRDLRSPIGSHCGAVIPAPEQRGQEALRWARGQVGAKYDRRDVPVIILEHLFTHLQLNYAPPGKFSCAEFVVRAFREAGVDLFPGREAAGIDPADFERLLPPTAKPGSLIG